MAIRANRRPKKVKPNPVIEKLEQDVAKAVRHAEQVQSEVTQQVNELKNSLLWREQENGQLRGMIDKGKKERNEIIEKLNKFAGSFRNGSRLKSLRHGQWGHHYYFTFYPYLRRIGDDQSRKPPFRRPLTWSSSPPGQAQERRDHPAQRNSL